MLFVLIGYDAPDSLPKRREVRPLHLARAQALRDEGRLVLAGPFPAIDADDPGEAGFTGSLFVAEFPSAEAARAWIEDDPYVRHGIYSHYDIRPFKQVLP